MEKSKTFLEYIARSLVENPSAVFVESRSDDMGVLLTLHVSPEDMGKIIGKGGETAKSIRTLLRAIGFNERAHVSLKIAEPEGSTRIVK